MGPAEFTCLLPVHGGDDATHFREAAESLGRSTLLPREILVCQDGPLAAPLSTAVADCMGALGARLVRNPGPAGLHHNLNHGLREVRTPWIARCDADDINLPHRFEAQVSFLSRHPEVGVLGGELIEFWPDGRERRKTMPRTHENVVAWARWRSPINHNTVFCRTDDVLGCDGYPNLPFKEDYGLWLRLIGAGVRFANIGEPLVRARLGATFYRRRAGLKNLRSEWSLYRIRTRIPGMGGAAAVVALLARSAALAMSGPTSLIYEWGLRR
jgi:glycosyltransferase involved in cell wall biosynthesis